MRSEWLSILWREGWLGSRRRNDSKPQKRSARTRLERFRKVRSKAKLDLPRNNGHTPSSSSPAAKGRPPPNGEPLPF